MREYGCQKFAIFFSQSLSMNNSVDTLYKQGAEGKIFKVNYLGKPAVIKERFKKKYRNEELDARLTKERIRAEAKSILRCRTAGITVPSIYLVDLVSRRIIMEYLENSKTVSERIYELVTIDATNNNQELKQIAMKMGNVIGKMHHKNIIHGDLTTSNILIKFEPDNTWDLCFIDFGLSYTKSSDEDKAVDLYVLERALKSRYNDIAWFFEEFFISYLAFNESNKRVVKKFNEVRSRGRKRTMVG